jgi:hypothetical protein
VIYHTLVIENGHVTRIEDHIDRDRALADLGLALGDAAGDEP